MSEIPNEDWFLREIQAAKSIQRLEYLASEIKYDQWEELEYTQNEGTMKRIRQAYAERIAEIRESGK